jgi:GTP-dependent phosphoenolpyruvate carboxykinase
LHSTKSNNLLKKNEITKSSKSLTRSILSRSNSKESAAATANKQRSRTCSQTNTSTIINNQSPSNFRKVVQIFTTSQMMGKLLFAYLFS